MEDRYKLQDWWDAHAYVYESLGQGGDEALFGRLKEKFAHLAEVRGEPIVYRRKLVAADFRDPLKWPNLNQGAPDLLMLVR